jgi:SAM-dependent methyltransferase
MTDDLIYDDTDVFAMLDALLANRGHDWWDGFYADRAKPCPFFTAAPCESLAEWVDTGLIRPGRALDLGCGHGRNAVFLAQRGFEVEGIDYSQKAIDWAAERARAAGVAVAWRCQSVFDIAVEPGSCDLVYDSGCFHHLSPHRRRGYVELVSTALKPNGVFALTCFRPEGGSGLTDFEVYERRSLGGGLGYTEAQLRAIWSKALEVEVIRPMRRQPAGSSLFGENFLWALLARKLLP